MIRSGAASSAGPSTTSDKARRFYGLKVFEELMLATEDLYMVFVAFRVVLSSDDEEIIRDEIDEYVVTDAIRSHYINIFEHKLQMP